MISDDSAITLNFISQTPSPIRVISLNEREYVQDVICALNSTDKNMFLILFLKEELELISFIQDLHVNNTPTLTNPNPLL